MKGELLLVAFMFVAVNASAQQRSQESNETAPLSSTVDARAGRTATTASGEVGKRQTREETAPNTATLGRIQNRVANRVQNRTRNRIDRYYDPVANSASPFEVAGDRARNAGMRPRP